MMKNLPTQRVLELLDTIIKQLGMMIEIEVLIM